MLMIKIGYCFEKFEYFSDRLGHALNLTGEYVLNAFPNYLLIFFNDIRNEATHNVLILLELKNFA